MYNRKKTMNKEKTELVVSELNQEVTPNGTAVTLELTFSLCTALTDCGLIIDSVLDNINDLRDLYPKTKCLMEESKKKKLD